LKQKEVIAVKSLARTLISFVTVPCVGENKVYPERTLTCGATTNISFLRCDMGEICYPANIFEVILSLKNKFYKF